MTSESCPVCNFIRELRVRDGDFCFPFMPEGDVTPLLRMNREQMVHAKHEWSLPPIVS
jgi:hypothetical protein